MYMKVLSENITVILATPHWQSVNEAQAEGATVIPRPGDNKNGTA